MANTDGENGRIDLSEINDKKYPCLRCLKLRVDKKSPTLECTCFAFTSFCFQWKKNIGTVTPWAIKCFGFCNKENDLLDTEDDIHKYWTTKLMREGKSPEETRVYIDNLQRSQKLSSSQMVGLKELYYEETHPKLSGPSKNESCGTACKIIKKNPLLDGEMSGKSWKGVGSIDMSTYDSIERNKDAKRMEAKKKGIKDPTTELKGVRRVANGGAGKESKTSDTKIITTDVAKSRKGIKK